MRWAQTRDERRRSNPERSGDARAHTHTHSLFLGESRAPTKVAGVHHFASRAKRLRPTASLLGPVAMGLRASACSLHVSVRPVRPREAFRSGAEHASEACSTRSARRGKDGTFSSSKAHGASMYRTSRCNRIRFLPLWPAVAGGAGVGENKEAKTKLRK